MEGSLLSEEQTRMIFETRTLEAGEGIPVDDIIEASNHFRCVDYVLDVATEPLSEEMIKRLHFLLKQGTKDSDLDWFAVRAYKKRPNTVGGWETCRPSDVPRERKKLLDAYTAKEIVTLDDIIAFHVDFERIHPFQDGNGRVGRLIAFKECLRFNLTPFIIEDRKKSFYYRGLANWEREKGWLKETCSDGQDTISALLEMYYAPETE